MSTPDPGPSPTVRVAVDLLGGDDAPGVVAAAVARWQRERDTDGVRLVLVGPPDLARLAVAEHGGDPEDPSLAYAVARLGVPMDSAPVTAARTSAGVGVRVAADLVRDGRADVLVSAGHTGAAVIATSLSWGRTAGALRPALAVLLPGAHGPVVLLDVGATLDPTPDVLVSHAALGIAYARELGLAVDPQVGLLSIGAEDGKGDALRRAAATALSVSLGGTYFVGNVEGGDLLSAAELHVVVTDGFTGNVLLKGFEGAVRWGARVALAAYDDPAPGRRRLADAVRAPYGAGVLLGVRGDAVVAHGAADAGALLTAVEVAVQTVLRRLAEPAVLADPRVPVA